MPNSTNENLRSVSGQRARAERRLRVRQRGAWPGERLPSLAPTEEVETRIKAERVLTTLLGAKSVELNTSTDQITSLPAELLDWAVAKLDHAANSAEKALAHRRMVIQKLLVVEEQIDRKQADTSRILARLTRDESHGC